MLRNRSGRSRRASRTLALLMLSVAALLSPTAQARSLDPLDAVQRDLCHRRLALLGESGTHGDGRTEAFKVELVERLVTKCGFSTIVFESGVYDFAEFNRLRRIGQATPAMLAAAVGGYRRGDRAFAPLLTFLFDGAMTGQLRVTGMDDQLGEEGSFYADARMMDELLRPLAPKRREDCRERLRQRINYDFPPARPYAPSDKVVLQACLADMRRVASAHERRLVLLDNMDRFIERDFMAATNGFAARDRSMFFNLQAIIQPRPRERTIVWSATVHLAKDASASDSLGGKPNLGAWIHGVYGSDAFVLGFGSAGGAYRASRRAPPRLVPPAPPGSLERLALEQVSGDTAYLGPTALADLGSVSGAIFRHDQRIIARWTRVVDGAVIFRDEEPAELLP